MLRKLEQAICSSHVRPHFVYLLFLIIIVFCGYILLTPVKPLAPNNPFHQRNSASVAIYKGLNYSNQLSTGKMLPTTSSTALNHSNLPQGEGTYHRTAVTNPPGVGFLLALRYTDQLTQGGVNVFCLQCVASAMDRRLKVVEPFIMNSTFGLPLDSGNPSVKSFSMSSAPRLRDVYDLKEWASYSQEKHFAPLESWESFLEAAPRAVVLVEHAWGECSFPQLEEKCNPFFHLNNFKVIRKVCLYFKSTGALELSQYKKRVYGDLDPANVTVIFNRWLEVAAFVEKFTVSIKGRQCSWGALRSPLYAHITPNKQLESDGEKYVSLYLRNAADNMYIAIMLRTEMIVARNMKKDLSQRLGLISKCVDTVIQKWTYLKEHLGLHETFVALDYGRYGTNGFYSSLPSKINISQLKKKVEQMLQTLKQGNVQEWEDRFGNVTSLQTPGYVATLQKTIASKARCLITAGGGTFQEHAFTLHQKVYGNNCHIRLKNDCSVGDTQVPTSLT